MRVPMQSRGVIRTIAATPSGLANRRGVSPQVDDFNPFGNVNCNDPFLDPLSRFFACPPDLSNIFDIGPPTPPIDCDFTSFCVGPVRKCQSTCRVFGRPTPPRVFDCGICGFDISR